MTRMETAKPVLFLDSGIGGIPYCRYFLKRNPDENIVYLADRQYFPYGGREKNELTTILIKLLEKVIPIIHPKIIVLACNTASLSSLPQLREHFPEHLFVGTVPAVKPAALASKTGKIGVLGTEFTINEPFIKELAAQNGCEITGIAAPELVEFIENNINTSSAEEKSRTARSYVNRFREAGVDTLVLGCTHFLFMLKHFQREAVPDITIFDSIKGITRRIESLLSQLPKEQPCPRLQNRLLLSGTAKPEASWIGWAARLGFSLSLLGDI